MNDETRLKLLVRELFDTYLDYTEIHGEDNHEVHPIHISCSRAMMAQPLSDLIAELKELSHK